MPPDDDSKKKPKVGVKLTNEGSIFSNIPKKPSKQEFEESVKNAENRNISYKERASELAISFRKLLNDRTLTQNKVIFSTELEREILGKLAQLAIDMNVDELEAEGMGSVGLITLLFSCLLIQRDKINNLDYLLNQLDLKLKNIESPVVDSQKLSE